MGGQISATERMQTKVLKKRFARAIAIANKLAYLDISVEKKLEVIEMKVLAMALYGTELANPPEECLKKLAAAIVRAIVGRNSGRKVVLVFENNKIRGRDVEPVSITAKHRILQLRRMLERKPEAEGLVREIMQYYNAKAEPGTVQGNAGSFNKVTPHPNTHSRTRGIEGN